MYKVVLSPEEKKRLEARHRQTRDVNELDRIKAVLLRSEGWTVAAIAQALRVHENTVSRHIVDFLSHNKLNFSKGGSESFLSKGQTIELIKCLSDDLHHQTYEIIALIQKKWAINYSIPGITKWLRRNGFSYKRPQGRPSKADPEIQKKFIEHYQNLKSSLKSDEKILFMDAVHPTQTTKLSYGWIRTGKTKAVKTTAGRTRVNVLGAIELGNLSNAVISDYQTINSGYVRQFLGLIRSKYAICKKIHLILDQAGYHRTQDLRQEAERLNIELHYLPPYSPNLNPTERLWKVMNEYARNNRFFASAREFREAINTFFTQTLPRVGSQLANRINDNFQIFNPSL